MEVFMYARFNGSPDDFCDVGWHTGDNGSILVFGG
jgi:hypothetical protein